MGVISQTVSRAGTWDQKQTDWEFRNDVRIDRLGYNRKRVILLGASARRGALPS